MDSQDRSGFAGRLAEPIYNLTPENYDSLHRAVSEHLSQQNRINSPEGEQMPRSSIPEGQNFRNWSLQGCNNNNSTLQESSLQQDVSKNRSLGSSSEDLQQLFLRSSGNPLAALLQQQLLTMRLQQSGSSEPNLVGLGTSTTASGGNIATTGLSSFVNGAGQSAEGSPFLQMAPSAVSLASNASLQPSGQESLIGSAPRVGASSSGMCVFGNYAASSSEQLQAASGFPTGVLGSTSTLPMIPQPTSFSGFYPELPQVTLKSRHAICWGV
ncbi:unnamed protein product [Amoebophrya sp. A25]|nr:unnamed protein product [Amoebophrya sp. A25]|eukprot:GSA25T00003917001.1